MKFLFFDTECSNCFNGEGKLCEFGYVLTDENFNIVTKNDIPMSPGRGSNYRFNLRDRTNNEGIDLAYDEDYYFDQEEFPYHYKRISKLLTDEDTLVFGYSIDNDIRYLDSTIKRYKKEPIYFVAHDIQKLVQKYLSECGGAIGLEKVFNSFATFEDKKGIIPHLSRDDAYMTMKIFEHICHKLNCTPIDLINNIYPECKYNSKDYLDYFESTKEKREENKKVRAIMSRWKSLAGSNIDYENDPRIKLCPSRYLALDEDRFKQLVSKTDLKKYLPINSFVKTDIIVTLNQEDENQLKDHFKEMLTCKFVNIDEFC